MKRKNKRSVSTKCTSMGSMLAGCNFCFDNFDDKFSVSPETKFV